MKIQISEALKLCSESEWELIEHSFSPMVAMLPRSALKFRLGLARKLYAKSADLVSLQHLEPRKRTTRRKVEMFAEAIDRIEAALDLLANAQSVVPAPKDAHNRKIAEETRPLNMGSLEKRAYSEPANRKSQSLSALVVHALQQQGR
jgi:hypothetical protein